MRISTLQAAVTRELGFRSSLDWQKRYLFKVLEKLEHGYVVDTLLWPCPSADYADCCRHSSIVAQIAKVGYPLKTTAPRKRTLRSVVTVIIFVARARYVYLLLQIPLPSQLMFYVDSRSSEEWRPHKALKAAIDKSFAQMREGRMARRQLASS